MARTEQCSSTCRTLSNGISNNFHPNLSQAQNGIVWQTAIRNQFSCYRECPSGDQTEEDIHTRYLGSDRQIVKLSPTADPQNNTVYQAGAFALPSRYM